MGACVRGFRWRSTPGYSLAPLRGGCLETRGFPRKAPENCRTVSTCLHAERSGPEHRRCPRPIEWSHALPIICAVPGRAPWTFCQLCAQETTVLTGAMGRAAMATRDPCERCVQRFGPAATADVEEVPITPNSRSGEYFVPLSCLFRPYGRGRPRLLRTGAILRTSLPSPPFAAAAFVSYGR
jgi:hypothetical protein